MDALLYEGPPPPKWDKNFNPINRGKDKGSILNRGKRGEDIDAFWWKDDDGNLHSKTHSGWSTVGTPSGGSRPETGARKASDSGERTANSSGKNKGSSPQESRRITFDPKPDNKTVPTRPFRFCKATVTYLDKHGIWHHVGGITRIVNMPSTEDSDIYEFKAFVKRVFGERLKAKFPGGSIPTGHFISVCCPGEGTENAAVQLREHFDSDPRIVSKYGAAPSSPLAKNERLDSISLPVPDKYVTRH